MMQVPETELLLLLGGLSLLVGFLSGMLGIGGGILMAPLLLYVPVWVGLAPLPMRDVAGLTVVQGLVASLAGALTHRKFHFVSGRLTGWMGGSIFPAALVGGVVSDFVADRMLLGVFALMALAAALLICIPTKNNKDNCEQPLMATFSFSRVRAVLVAASVGFTGGLVGQGGSFLCIPLMISFMQVPLRIAVGSNLAIVFLSSLAAFMGKALTGQIFWQLAVSMILTVLPAAHLGALVSNRMPVFRLRLLLACCIGLAALRTGCSAIGL